MWMLKIESITEKTLVLGIDIGSKMHYARAFDYSGIEHLTKPIAKAEANHRIDKRGTIYDPISA